MCCVGHCYSWHETQPRVPFQTICLQGLSTKSCALHAKPVHKEREHWKRVLISYAKYFRITIEPYLDSIQTTRTWSQFVMGDESGPNASSTVPSILEGE